MVSKVLIFKTMRYDGVISMVQKRESVNKVLFKYYKEKAATIPLKLLT